MFANFPHFSIHNFTFSDWRSIIISKSLWLMFIFGTKNESTQTAQAQVQNWNRERKISFFPSLTLEKCFSHAFSRVRRCWCAHVLILLKIKWKVDFACAHAPRQCLGFLPVFFLFIYTRKSSACNFFLLFHSVYLLTLKHVRKTK